MEVTESRGNPLVSALQSRLPSSECGRSRNDTCCGPLDPQTGQIARYVPRAEVP